MCGSSRRRPTRFKRRKSVRQASSHSKTVRASRLESNKDDTIYYNPAYDMNFGVRQANKEELQGEQVAHQAPTSIVLADIKQTGEQVVPLASRPLFNKAFQVYDKKVNKLTVRTPLNCVGIRVLGSYLRREAWQAFLPTTVPQTASLCLQLSQLQMEDKTLEHDCVRRVLVRVVRNFATCHTKTKAEWAEQTKGVLQRVTYKHFKCMLGPTSNLDVSIGFIVFWYPWMERYVSFMFCVEYFAIVGPRLTDYSWLCTTKTMNQNTTTQDGTLGTRCTHSRAGRCELLHVHAYNNDARDSCVVVAACSACLTLVSLYVWTTRRTKVYQPVERLLC